MKRDRVVWSKELLSAQSIADLVGTSLREIDPPVEITTDEQQGGEVRRCTTAASIPVSSSGVTLDFEPERTDWGDADQVVVLISIPATSDPSASITSPPPMRVKALPPAPATEFSIGSGNAPRAR